MMCTMHMVSVLESLSSVMKKICKIVIKTVSMGGGGGGVRNFDWKDSKCLGISKHSGQVAKGSGALLRI